GCVQASSGSAYRGDSARWPYQPVCPVGRLAAAGLLCCGSGGPRAGSAPAREGEDMNTEIDLAKPPPALSRKRRLFRGLRTVLLCYLGILLVLLVLENWLVYHPTSAGQAWHAPPNAAVQDLDLHTADGTRIHAWWCPHPEA